MSGDRAEEEKQELVLVARKGGFDLPTACPICLPVYCYLRLAHVDFKLQFDRTNPDSDHIPYIEYGDCVAFNNEKGGVIDCLNEDKIVELDSQLSKDCFPDLVTTKALISTWLAEAVQYELWLSDVTIAYQIYFSDLPWPIGKILHWKQAQAVRQLHGITKENAEEKEEEIYRKANAAYESLSAKLGSEDFFFEGRPTSVDALFLGHAAFVLYALPETSVLRGGLVKHANLVRVAEALKNFLVEARSSSSSGPESSFGASSSSAPRRKDSNQSSKTKPKKRERTEEEKAFRRRAKYFIAAQVVSIVVFLSVLGGMSGVEDVDEDSLAYEE